VNGPQQDDMVVETREPRIRRAQVGDVLVHHHNARAELDPGFGVERRQRFGNTWAGHNDRKALPQRVVQQDVATAGGANPRLRKQPSDQRRFLSLAIRHDEALREARRRLEFHLRNIVARLGKQ